MVVDEIRSRKRAEPAAEQPKRESDMVLAQVQKVHGPNIMRRATVAGQWKHIPFDIFTLDLAMFGGLPRSAISMVIGWESAGKSLVSMRTIASAQRMFPDQRAILLDAEGTYSPPWGATHGIDNENLLLVQPETGEQALDITTALIRSSDVSIIVVDSLPALVPIKERDKSLEDDIVALQGRMIGRFIRYANLAILDERKRKHTPALFLINQWRNRLVLMGDNRNAPGGNAIKFFVSNRFEMMNKEVLGKDDRDVEIVTHNEHSFKITKFKEGTGIRNGAFTMIRDPSHPLGAGFIDEADTVLAFAKKFGVYSGAGKYQRFNDLDRNFGTMKEAADFLNQDRQFASQLKHRLISMHREHMGLSADGWL